MLFHQSGSRSQRPKGFKVKQTLQVALLLAVGFWLLYQIIYSNDKSKVYGTTVEKKLSKEEGSIALGRKGNAGSSDGVETISIRNRIEEGEKVEDGGGGDDELDRNADEKAEEESLHKEREESEESVTKHQEDNQRELDTTQEKSQSQLQSNEEVNTDTQLKVLDVAVSSDTNQDTRRNVDETALPPSEIEATGTTDQKEAENEGGGFQDVNGVPPDGHQLLNATPDEKIFDEEETTSLDQETASGPNNQPGLGESTTLFVVELGKSSELNGTNDVDMTIDDKVIEREFVQFNESIHETQDSTSVPSEKEEETTVASLKMILPQEENESQSNE